VPRALPSGTVTLLFTDIEGSTHLLHELGAARYAAALAEHRRAIRDAFGRRGGVEVDTQGDAFFVAFASAVEAVSAAADAQRSLADGPVRVRMGLHTGAPHVADEGYVGPDVHLGARIAAAGHGGQVLLSAATKEAAAAASAAFQLVDLGEHRLKDFDRPIAIFQLGPIAFPPLRTISNTNLPRPASSFVGRESEIADVTARLRDGTRLLTLTGPGGSGKTRLAVEAASELVPAFRAGVFWVGVAALRDPALVLPTVATTIGAGDALAAAIGERELLLVIDNLEQVVAAASALADLVESCPNLRVLATSRERLRVRGEEELRVLPLADRDAVRLFAERAGVTTGALGSGPDPDVLALVRALDNLPLAVELAAARTSVLSAAQILARLGHRLDLLRGGRDADPRQQTLRATIEWSHGLLEPHERRLFARLAVFRGGWTLEAAELVADADLDTLGSLVDKSLVRARDGRFSMLETIRELATERLETSGERDELLDRHVAHFLRLVEEAEPHLRLDERDWVDRLGRDHDNLRAALDRLESAGRTEELLRVTAAVWRFWYLRSELEEGRSRLEAALAADGRPTALRAKALDGASVMALNLGDTASAESLAREALALHEELGDSWGAAYATMMIGNALAEGGDAGAARPIMEEAARRFEDLGDRQYALIATSNLAWISEESGDVALGRTIRKQALEMAREAGNERMIANIGAELGIIRVDEGRPDDGLALLAEALAINLERGDRQHVAIDLGRVAYALAHVGRLADAARMLAASRGAFESIGAAVPFWAAERDGTTLERIRAALPDDEVERATTEGRSMSVEEAVALAVAGPPPQP
jgi:predicted ATPase/class 3 adenylate cyclase